MSILALRLDLAAAKALVWLASFSRDGDLTPEAHRYFYDRYTSLADFHARRGHPRKAVRFRERADEHRRLGGFYPDGPPYAAAMAMPRPRRWIAVDATSRVHVDGDGPDAA